MTRDGEKPIYVVLMQIIGPALIIVMVASLVFFLIEVLYRGPHNLRLYWVLGLFTCASVLVSRISIEEGRERAMLFGIALAVATFVASLRLVEFAYVGAAFLGPIVITVLIAVVMWASSKLTWDCTVVDRSRDVSAMGLLEMFKRRISKSDENVEPLESEGDTPKSASVDWWTKLLFGGEKSNTPGIWVFYFAVLAFPLFGFGQWFVLKESQSWIYVLFAVYLGATLGLLMTTSLLGLERYLAQRHVHVPNAIARNWLVVGGVFALIVVIAVMLVPRSTSSGSLSHVTALLKSPLRAATKWATGKDGQEEDEEAKGNKPGEKGAMKDNRNAKNGGGKSKGKEGDANSKESGSDSKSGEADRESRQRKNGDAQIEAERETSRERKGQDERRSDKGERQARAQDNKRRSDKNSADNKNADRRHQRRAEAPKQQAGSPKTQSALNKLMKQLASVTKWLGYLLGLVALGFLLWLFRDDLARIWGVLFAKKKSEIQEPEAATKMVLRRPEPSFSSFKNPFAGGETKGMTAHQLVHYSMAAMEALGRDFGLHRNEDSTVVEFARQLRALDDGLGEQAGQFAHLYGQCAFGSEPIGRNEIEPLVNLWRQMMATAATKNVSAAVERTSA